MSDTAPSVTPTSEDSSILNDTLLTAASIAEILGGEVVGDPLRTVTGVAPLLSANSQQLSFLGLQTFRKQLSQTAAGVVLISETDIQDLNTTGIVVDNPHVCFAKIAAIFERSAEYEVGIHETAVIHPSANIAEGASIGAHCVIGSDTRIGEGVIIGPNTVIMNHCQIGNNTHLRANNTVYQYVQIGERCIFHAGVVIGSDGFGYAVERQSDGSGDDGTGHSWFKVPQIGTVIIGNDVEIGANSAVDRGALEDTILCDGVKIDNLVQIAHNVYLGENTAIAGSSAIAGSAVIGANCKIMGSVLVLGHLELCDGVTISARSLVTRTIRKPGTYSSSISVQEADKWRKNHARLKQLDQLAGRVKTLEKAQRAG